MIHRIFAFLAVLSASAVAQVSMADVTAAAQAAPAAPAAPAAEVPAARPDTSLGRPPGMAVDFSAVLQVEEPEKIADLVVARAESLGGWFSSRGKTALQLRIPVAAADSFLSGLASLGVLLDRSLTSTSLEASLDEANSRLKARKATLRDYYAMLKESGDSTVFTIQREIAELQAEIERTQGTVLNLKDRMAYARATIHFRFQERGAPLATGKSRFRWLNRLGLPEMLGRFRHGPD